MGDYLSECCKMLTGYLNYLLNANSLSNTTGVSTVIKAQPPAITKCYIVGEAIHMEEYRSLGAGLAMSLVYGLENGMKKLRVLDKQTIIDEAFPSGKISRIFSDYQEALKYVKTLMPEICNFDSSNPCISAAPLLTAETYDPIVAWPTEGIIKGSADYLSGHFVMRYKENDHYYKRPKNDVKYSFIKTDLSVNQVSLIQAEFPTLEKMEPIKFDNNKKKKYN